MCGYPPSGMQPGAESVTMIRDTLQRTAPRLLDVRNAVLMAKFNHSQGHRAVLKVAERLQLTQPS